MTTLNADGSTTTLEEERAEDDGLLMQSRISTSDDGLVVISETDADGDGSFDLTTTATTVLLSDGGTEVTTEIRDDAAALRSRTVMTTSDNGRDATEAMDINGDGADDMITTAIVADTGIRTTTISEFDADGVLQSRVETEVSAAGLTETVRSDADGNGLFERQTQTATVLDIDGGRTTTEASTGHDGTLHSRTVTTISDDGLTTSASVDADGDGTADLTIIAATTIAADGERLETSETRTADAALLENVTTTISADGRSIVSETDADGNGVRDSRVEVTITDRGETLTEESFYSSGGVLEATRSDTVSGNGFSRMSSIDRNADGIAEYTRAETGGIKTNGTTWSQVQHYTGLNVALAREEYTASADGLATTTKIDLDGDGLFESRTSGLTTLLGNGDIAAHTVTIDENQATISERTVTTSGDGLVTEDNLDADGDGIVDRLTTTTLGAGGGLTEIATEYTDVFQISRITTRDVSADGWTVTLELDRDGDGTLDQRMVETADDSRTVATVYEDLDAMGSVAAGVTVTEPVNGLTWSAVSDVDGDGAADVGRASQTSFTGSGDRITSYTETVGAGVTTYAETQTEAANGLSRTSTIDTDGDGVIDGTTVETTTLNTDGSRTLISETTYANGDLRARTEIEAGRDGRSVVERHDYDGNGLVDNVTETEIRADGETIATERGFNEAGYETNTFVTRTSSDGLITTIHRDGIVQTNHPVRRGQWQLYLGQRPERWPACCCRTRG